MATWVVAVLCTPVQAEPNALPRYIQYGQDPVQKVFSSAVAGFAFERKCTFLSTSSRAAFLTSLNQASIIFRSYLIAMKIGSDPADTAAYIREMTQGAIVFTASADCDESARQAVDKGLDSSLRFKELIESQLQSPAPR
jgi:hypothetical protein